MAASLELDLSGGAANTDPNASLGGARSSAGGGVVPAALTANSLFPDVTGAQEQAGLVDYRAVYLHNTGGVDAQNVVAWLSADTADPDTTIDIGVGTSAAGVDEQTIANETTAPTGVTFSAPATEGAGLDVGTITAGSFKAIWLRRTINAGAGASTDQFTVNTAFDTAP